MDQKVLLAAREVPLGTKGFGIFFVLLTTPLCGLKNIFLVRQKSTVIGQKKYHYGLEDLAPIFGMLTTLIRDLEFFSIRQKKHGY